MYKQDLALNNLRWLICHKTQPNHDLLYYIGCLNIHGTHVITYNSTNNNVLFCFRFENNSNKKEDKH